MYLNVPTNWDHKIVKLVRDINQDDQYIYKIKQVYGSCLTFIGSGRLDTPEISRNIVTKHIDEIKKMGIMFNFIINAPSLGGIEHDRSHRQKILDTLCWIDDLGVDMVTVSIPFLGELINHYFPHMLIKLSTILDVRSIQNIHLLEELGPTIHSVTVSRFINRDFMLLKKIVKTATYEIELLANSICLLNCPYQKYHADLVCWFAKSNKGWEEPFTDYRSIGCDKIRLNNLSEIIKSPWIRPEDLKFYKTLGIHSIKLAGRTFPTQELSTIIKSYSKGKFSGNLWELIAPHLPIYVNNNELDGFIDFFIDKNYVCNSHCGECTYCHDIASKYVSLTRNSNRFLLDLNKRLHARIDISKKMKPFLNQSIL